MEERLYEEWREEASSKLEVMGRLMDYEWTARSVEKNVERCVGGGGGGLGNKNLKGGGGGGGGGGGADLRIET